MLDWFRGQIDLHHTPIPSGVVLSIDVDSSIEWQSVKKTSLIERRGSHESTIKIRSVGGNGKGMATGLQIDGNLAKFLQGHNLFGTEDLNQQLLLTFQKIIVAHGDLIEPWDVDLAIQKIKRGDYLVKMIDVNRMFDLSNDQSVESWLHAAEMKARSRAGRATRDKGTVYLMKNSRRWGFKFYNKFREMNAGKKHRLPDDLIDSGLLDFANGKLRGELRLHALELKNLGVTHGKHVTPAWLDKTFNDYLGKIEMNTQATLIDSQLINLPRSCQSTYQLWRQGASLKDILPHNTFYRHRRTLLTSGIDITCPPSSPDHQNVIPMFRVLEAVPVSIPTWAFQKGLVAL